MKITSSLKRSRNVCARGWKFRSSKVSRSRSALDVEWCQTTEKKRKTQNTIAMKQNCEISLTRTTLGVDFCGFWIVYAHTHTRTYKHTWWCAIKQTKLIRTHGKFAEVKLRKKWQSTKFAQILSSKTRQKLQPKIEVWMCHACFFISSTR